METKLEKKFRKKIFLGCFFEYVNLHGRGPLLCLVPRDTPVAQMFHLKIFGKDGEYFVPPYRTSCGYQE